MTWLTQTTIGQFLSTMFISMVPIVELRGGLPYGIALGLDYPIALAAAIIGNMLPIPVIIFFIEKIFAFLRKHFPPMDSFITKLENRGREKEETVKKYGMLGLIILVAIPLPGTGAWTGALVASLMNIKPKHAFPCIFIGVCIAAFIVSVVTYGVIKIV